MDGWNVDWGSKEYTLRVDNDLVGCGLSTLYDVATTTFVQRHIVSNNLQFTITL